MKSNISSLINKAKDNTQKKVVQKVVPVKEKKQIKKKYLNLYVSKDAEEFMNTIKREVEYKDREKYIYGDIFEDAMKALAKEKGILL